MIGLENQFSVLEWQFYKDFTVAEQAGLGMIWWQNPEDRFPHSEAHMTSFQQILVIFSLYLPGNIGCGASILSRCFQ